MCYSKRGNKKNRLCTFLMEGLESYHRTFYFFDTSSLAYFVFFVDKTSVICTLKRHSFVWLRLENLRIKRTRPEHVTLFYVDIMKYFFFETETFVNTIIFRASKTQWWNFRDKQKDKCIIIIALRSYVTLSTLLMSKNKYGKNKQFCDNLFVLFTYSNYDLCTSKTYVDSVLYDEFN